MKRIIRLTESDLTRIVRRVISESENPEMAIENCDENDDAAMEMCIEKLFTDMTKEEAENYIIELVRRKPRWLKKLIKWFRKNGRDVRREIRKTSTGEKIMNTGAALTFATLATLMIKHTREIADKILDVRDRN
jgi:hypothetical protein